MSAALQVHDRVRFEQAGKQESGWIVGIKRDINNGRGFAVVELDGPLPGCVETVPLDQVQLEQRL